MFSALIVGLGNHLKTQWGSFPSNTGDKSVIVKYGGTDSYWNKFNLDRIETPGLIYGVSSISFPSGFSGHNNFVPIQNNVSNTTGFKLKLVKAQVDISLGMFARDENEHFWHIEKYVEMATNNAELKYKVLLPNNEQELWTSSMSNFSELSPPPTGKQSSSYDTEGQIYTVEATFTVFTSFVLSQENKIIRAIITQPSIDSDIKLMNRDLK